MMYFMVSLMMRCVSGQSTGNRAAAALRHIIAPKFVYDAVRHYMS